MSDRPIQVGDLVMVVRSTDCGHDFMTGKVFVVLEISCTPATCTVCGRVSAPHFYAWKDYCNGGWGAELSRLKRLDPDALRDDVPADERMKERA